MKVHGMETMIIQYWTLSENEKERNRCVERNRRRSNQRWGGPTEKREEGTRDQEDEPNILRGTMDWSHEIYLVRWLLGVTITLLAVAGSIAFRSVAA